jgi:hypothetical protein
MFSGADSNRLLNLCIEGTGECGGLGSPLRTVEGNTSPTGSSNELGVFELNRRKIPDAPLKGFIDFT